jgi:hypothetical protein
MKARVGDWFVFRVADGRFAAARIGAVARPGNSYREFEEMRERLEALASELGGEYDGHERAVA